MCVVYSLDPQCQGSVPPGSFAAARRVVWRKPTIRFRVILIPSSQFAQWAYGYTRARHQIITVTMHDCPLVMAAVFCNMRCFLVDDTALDSFQVLLLKRPIEERSNKASDNLSRQAWCKVQSILNPLQ